MANRDCVHLHVPGKIAIESRQMTGRFTHIEQFGALTTEMLKFRLRSAFFHVQNNLAKPALAGKLDFLNQLADVLAENGLEPVLVQGCKRIEEFAAAEPRHLHINMQDRPVQGDNILSCSPSYLRGFWYLDRQGTRNNSSLAQQDFQPSTMDADFARTFFARLRKTFVTTNRSKFPQTDRKPKSVKMGSISLFLQDFRPAPYAPAYVDYTDLMQVVVENRGARHVYIKPHPLQRVHELEHIMPYHDPGAGVSVVDTSVHDLLAHSDMAVSQTSAVGFEANLHRVPMIMAGQVDFHHNCVTLRSPAHYADAMNSALTSRFHYEKYLVWFLKHNLFEPAQGARTRERCAALLREMGIIA